MEKHELIEKVKTLYAQGFSANAISAQIGVNRLTVYAWLRRHGVEIRKAGRPIKVGFKSQQQEDLARRFETLKANHAKLLAENEELRNFIAELTKNH